MAIAGKRFVKVRYPDDYWIVAEDDHVGISVAKESLMENAYDCAVVGPAPEGADETDENYIWRE